ncbi:phage tail tube protein [Nocardiopsis mwathae]
MASLYTVNKDLVFKGLFTAVFVASYTTPVPDQLFDPDTGELEPLPEGWYPVGYTGEDGTTHDRDRDLAETKAAQEATSVRDDINSDTQTAKFTMLETSPVSIALYEGLQFDELGTDLGKPLRWAKPAVPPTVDRRWLFLASDRSKTTGQERVRARLFPRGAVTDVGGAQESRSDATGYETTVKAYMDPVFGTDVLNWLDGPGWRELAGGRPDPSS